MEVIEALYTTRQDTMRCSRCSRRAGFQVGTALRNDFDVLLGGKEPEHVASERRTSAGWKQQDRPD